MKTVIEMARIAGVRDDGHRFEFSEYKYLERFAELVRADERELIYFQTSSDFVKAAVLTEREACAKVCDVLDAEVDKYPAACAAAIRARSNT